MDKTSMDTEMKNMVQASDKDAQYDEKAKRLLGHKYILAYILVNTVDEFKGMNPRDVVQYIEGEPLIGVVPVEPGMTNFQEDDPVKKGQRIVGFNSENAEIHEGLVRFDIVFYVRMRDGLSQMIVNVESQKDEPSGYDLLNIVLIGLSNDLPGHDEKYELHLLLGALLSKQLSVDEKLAIIEKEYKIPAETGIRKEVASMCNLSQGIREDAQAEIIMNMYRNGFTIKQIEIAVRKSAEEIKAIIEKQESVLE